MENISFLIAMFNHTRVTAMAANQGRTFTSLPKDSVTRSEVAHRKGQKKKERYFSSKEKIVCMLNRKTKEAGISGTQGKKEHRKRGGRKKPAVRYLFYRDFANDFPEISDAI